MKNETDRTWLTDEKHLDSFKEEAIQCLGTIQNTNYQPKHKQWANTICFGLYNKHEIHICCAYVVATTASLFTGYRMRVYDAHPSHSKQENEQRWTKRVVVR